MAESSSIEWTDATWNPVTGCSKVSPGCAHCYAERIAERFRGTRGFPSGFDISLRHDKLQLPLSWRNPKRIFVNSMSDLFHEDVPLEFIEHVFETMERAHWHKFQVLTKRGERLRELAPLLRWPTNVWMGVSVEYQRWTSRVAILRDVPASVRFLSLEPLLGPLDLDLEGIHWVIVGGESGPGSRRMRPEWVHSIREQCMEKNVPFFFKQWGSFDANGVKGSKVRNGRDLNGRTWNQMPNSQSGYGESTNADADCNGRTTR